MHIFVSYSCIVKFLSVLVSDLGVIFFLVLWYINLCSLFVFFSLFYFTIFNCFFSFLSFYITITTSSKHQTPVTLHWLNHYDPFRLQGRKMTIIDRTLGWSWHYASTSQVTTPSCTCIRSLKDTDYKIVLDLYTFLLTYANVYDKSFELEALYQFWDKKSRTSLVNGE